MRIGIVVLIVVLVAVSLVGLLLFVSEGGLGGGRGYGAQTNQNSLDRSIWLVVFATPLVAALAVAVYALLFPQIKVEKKMAIIEPAKLATETPATPASAEKSQTLEAVLRVLNVDEQKIVNAIADSGGAMLQKDIKLKTGLSRVKTHRVLARLSARRLVRAEKYYNTNRIVLADWITNDKKIKQ